MCADGLKGLKEAISTVYPMTEFQRCIVHMIRNTLQYVSYKDRKEFSRDLKQIYQATTEDIAYNNLIELEDKLKDRKAIESLNNSYKKLNRGRRVFPTIQSLEKSIYLSTQIITEKWTSRYPNWGVTIAELHTYFSDRVVIN